ncbi:MAG: 2-succinyl-6-hydroxy-2,4-cyclohexadiene-1-carboxylate synthase [Opitutaceae bacterium]
MHILALHGFTGVGADFSPFVQECSGHWLTPDLPGHGTKDNDCTPAATRQWIEAKRNELPVDKKVLLGYSMGARAALLHACEFPDVWDALVLISANPGIEATEERTIRCQSDNALADRIERDGVPSFLQFWQHQPIIRSQQSIHPDWLSQMQINRLKHSEDGLAQSLRQFGQGSCPNLWPELKQLSMPVLCLTGALDSKYGSIAERMTKVLPNAQHFTIPNAGHMPHLENPKPSAYEINHFLSA